MIAGAKCKLCESIIKPGGRFDLVSCNCGEISIDYATGELHANIQKSPSNLILIDDEGNEIIPTRSAEIPQEESLEKPSKEDLINMLDDMRKRIEELPPGALYAPVTHSDFCSLLILLSGLFRSD